MRHIRVSTKENARPHQKQTALLDQDHGEVRMGIMRCIRGTLGNPALVGSWWGRRKRRRGICLAGCVDGTYGLRKVKLLRGRGRYGCSIGARWRGKSAEMCDG
jgi:hypothetical protein